MTTATVQTIVERLLKQFNQPGARVQDLLQAINEQILSLSAGAEVCAYTDHCNGVSLLRLGKKPSKADVAKQTFQLCLRWNSWKEADGVGNEIEQARIIVRTALSAEAEDFLNDLRTQAETLKDNLNLKPERSILQRRTPVQVKWGIVAAGEKSFTLLSNIELFADSRMPVIIIGETGCGKELVANALHSASRRKGKFFAINCAAIPKELIESELFGHKKGAFTGATDSRDGYFQAAHDGTLFLDEIGELSLDLQAKLLRVLQEGKVRRVGSNVEEQVRVRVVAATNRNLKEMVEKGEFRIDLFYRLHGLCLNLLPLRERLDELPHLVDFLLKKLSEELCREITIDESAMRLLIGHQFPGNVRELVNLLEAGAVYAQSGIIEAQHLRSSGLSDVVEEVSEQAESGEDFTLLQSDIPIDLQKFLNMTGGKSYEELREEFDRKIFAFALDQSNGQINRAAEMLGMERSTFSRNAKKLGLTEKKTNSLHLSLVSSQPSSPNAQALAA